MERTTDDLALMLYGCGFEKLSERDKRLLRRLLSRTAISRDIDADYSGRMTLGERVADKVASFGGSWTFIFLFMGFILLWVAVNAWAMLNPVDPYPFVFLNLVLSMVAAVQAPVIMMSQNRQAAKDRAAAEHDYEVNLKAELAIMSLHEKLDDLRQRQLTGHFTRIEERLAAIEAASPDKPGGNQPAQ